QGKAVVRHDVAYSARHAANKRRRQRQIGEFAKDDFHGRILLHLRHQSLRQQGQGAHCSEAGRLQRRFPRHQALHADEKHQLLKIGAARAQG
ncbi:hypothetical protein PMAYCL1PPCAC_03905, partial [Pristionchus mayeri]